MSRILNFFPRSLKVPLLLMILSSLIISLTSLVVYFRLQPVIPLFYTLIQTENQLAAKEWLFLFPILSALITLIHVVILSRLLNYEQVVIQLFTWMSVVMQALLLIAFFRILVIIS